MRVFEINLEKELDFPRTGRNKLVHGNKFLKGEFRSHEFAENVGFQEVMVKFYTPEDYQRFRYELTVLDQLVFCKHVVRLAAYSEGSKRALVFQYQELTLAEYFNKKRGSLDLTDILKSCLGCIFKKPVIIQ